MTSASGFFESPYGKISSGWEKIPLGGYIYRVSIPANTTASLILAAPSVKSVLILQGKDGVAPMKFSAGKVMSNLKSGTYEFEVKK